MVIWVSKKDESKWVNLYLAEHILWMDASQTNVFVIFRN